MRSIVLAATLLSATVSHAQGLSLVKSRFLMVNPAETALARNVEYTSSTCLVGATAGIPVKISKASTTVFVGLTDGNGCIGWTDSIPHRFYTGKRFFEVDYSITVGSTSKDVKVILNPWDDKFTFGFDERELDDATLKKILAMRGPVPTLSLSQYRLISVRNFDDRIEVRIVFKTAVKGHFDLFQGKRRLVEEGEPVREGVYKLNAQIIDADQSKIISDQTVYVKVIDGLADATLTVKRVSQSKNLLIAAKLIPTEEQGSSKLIQQTEPEIESIATKGPILNTSNGAGWNPLD